MNIGHSSTENSHSKAHSITFEMELPKRLETQKCAMGFSHVNVLVYIKNKVAAFLNQEPHSEMLSTLIGQRKL